MGGSRSDDARETRAEPASGGPTSPKARAATERRRRLAAELRANLRKRKSRGQSGDDGPPDAGNRDKLS